MQRSSALPRRGLRRLGVHHVTLRTWRTWMSWKKLQRLFGQSCVSNGSGGVQQGRSGNEKQGCSVSKSLAELRPSLLLPCLQITRLTHQSSGSGSPLRPSNAVTTTWRSCTTPRRLLAMVSSRRKNSRMSPLQAQAAATTFSQCLCQIAPFAWYACITWRLPWRMQRRQLVFVLIGDGLGAVWERHLLRDRQRHVRLGARRWSWTQRLSTRRAWRKAVAKVVWDRVLAA
mmetsp:Transcript_31182/g.56541  ORF Transcript_31182/g.56541 Transcript_31182/m.56541 type:complete len:229 (-) Transcript_31182:1363-2049(-)